MNQNDFIIGMDVDGVLRNWVQVLFQPEVARMIASKLVVGYGLEGKYFVEKPW